MSGIVAYATTVRRLPSGVVVAAFSAGRQREKRDRFMSLARADRKAGLGPTIVATWVRMARDEHRHFMRTMRELAVTGDA